MEAVKVEITAAIIEKIRSLVTSPDNEMVDLGMELISNMIYSEEDLDKFNKICDEMWEVDKRPTIKLCDAERRYSATKDMKIECEDLKVTQEFKLF